MDTLTGGNKTWHSMFDYLVLGIVQCGLYELAQPTYTESQLQWCLLVNQMSAANSYELLLF